MTKRSYFYDFLVRYMFSGNDFDHGIIFSSSLSSLISISVNTVKRYSKYSYGLRLLSFAVSTSE
nr:hypothetical protein [uncultured Thomasclavelia sp.]